MTKAQSTPFGASEVAAFGLLIGLSIALSACSLFRKQEISYAGPEIQGVRAFHLASPGNGNPRPILDGIFGLGPFLQWSSDGEQVLVEQARGEFYLAEPESGELGDCLTCNLPDARSAYISPDGELLAIGAKSGLYSLEIAGGSPILLTDFSQPAWIDWSPDGSHLLFSASLNMSGSRRFDIYSFNLESGVLSNLTQGRGEETADYFSPRWSPDGDQIAFHGSDSGGLHIMRMQSDGSDFSIVADWSPGSGGFVPESALPPQWSPNGELLAYSSFGITGGQSNSEIFVIGTDGSGLANLTNMPGSDVSPQWSADGKLIAFVTDRDGNAEIYTMDSDGGSPTNISNTPLMDELLPFWRP